MKTILESKIKFIRKALNFVRIYHLPVYNEAICRPSQDYPFKLFLKIFKL
jgi:capsule polysaccharide export protein KpsC/LpsZ